ncbi:helix-turn-helix domain-containing protein [Phreatobacter stygius]|uniref:Chromosomal replication initiator DnaA C-terminal domain-containing protein n=1 Tax=Phreatobacter stygius TaxID=1940610 RepID=A0A4D7B5G5_9HYPH|nr:helix-turn-helix domain-containing protein [Phreatobacter stygius]QCI65658.1 hypothetical protein E8M01_16450 [Phreatobacter stygius]
MTVSLSVRIIAETVAEHFGFTYRDLVSHRKPVEIREARAIAYLMARRFTPLSYPAIGEALGDRDHTTVLHGVRTVERQCRTSNSLANAVFEIDAALRAVELTLARAALVPPPDVDPLAVAYRVLSAERQTISPSRDEILALAVAVIGAAVTTPSQQSEPKPAQEPKHV